MLKIKTDRRSKKRKTRKQLISEVTKRTGIMHEATDEVIRCMFRTMTYWIQEGYNVCIHEFGSFQVIVVPAHEARTPIFKGITKPRVVLRFAPSEGLMKRFKEYSKHGEIQRGHQRGAGEDSEQNQHVSELREPSEDGGKNPSVS